MAWSTTMVSMLRTLIGDFDSTDYSDARLTTLIVNSAQYVHYEVDLDATYVIDVDNETISPDPTLTDTLDDGFTNLVVLKAACMVDQNELRTAAATGGLKAKAGPAVLETLQRTSGYVDMLNLGACKLYDEMKSNYMFGDGNICRAILSPFVGNNFDPTSLAPGRNDGLYR